MLPSQAQETLSKNSNKLRHAQLLLESYRQRPTNLKDLTLDQYITYYSNKMGQPSVPPFSKSQQQQLISKYQQLKQTLQILVQQSSSQLHKDKEDALPQYKQTKKLISKRQLATLQAIDNQLEQFTNTDQEEELTRIKKIIANGAWGCLQKIQERLAKLRQLQHDNNE